MHSLKRLICFLSLLFASVHCESYISKPGPGAETGDHEDNPTYKEGNDINFKWRTNITNVKLMLWQTWPNPGGGQAYYYNLLENGGEITEYTWTVSLNHFDSDYPDTENAILWLGLYENGNDGMNYDAYSHYFNVSKAKTDSTSTTTSGGTSTTPNAGSAPTLDSTSPPIESSNKDSGGLSCGAVAGISVGATIAGIMFLGGLGFFAGRAFQRGSQHKGSHDYQPAPPPPAAMVQETKPTTPPVQTLPYHAPQQSPPPPQQLDTPQVYHEVP